MFGHVSFGESRQNQLNNATRGGFDQEDNFEPDSAAAKNDRMMQAMIERGRKIEQGLLLSRHAVAMDAIESGGKMNMLAAGIQIFDGAGQSSGSKDVSSDIQMNEAKKRD